MSVARLAARGVAWNMFFGVGSRLLQLAGTLLITRFVAPDSYGAVLAASILVQTAGVMTTFAFGQYLIAHRAKPHEAFQATVLHIVLGVLTMLPVYAARHLFGRWLDSPGLDPFIWGYALAHLFDRVRYVPDRLLLRALRFRASATINGSGELLFTVVAVGLAPRLGGSALMLAALARSMLCCFASLAVAPRLEWLAPCRLERSTLRSLLAYGVPITVTSFADRAATRLDNLIVSKLFGSAVMGRYNLAYSLAEVPVSNVAEHIGEVLMPSFSRMEEEERRRATVRAAALMSLIVSPLGVGLGAVAPTLVATFFDARWVQMSPLLAILSVMTVFRPMTWSAIAYLQAVKETKIVMYLAFGRAVVALGLLAVFGLAGGVLWACVGACIGIALHAFATVIAAGRMTGLSTWGYVVGVGRPLLACAPMFAVVTFARRGLQTVTLPHALSLACEVVLGAAVFVASAMLLARPTVVELLRLARSTLRRA